MIRKQVESLRIHAKAEADEKMEEMLLDAADTIEALSEKVKVRTNNLSGGWIPVSERLPEEKAMVVACYADGSVGIIHEARPNLWRESYYLPVAWMPLPPAYQQVTDK